MPRRPLPIAALCAAAVTAACDGDSVRISPAGAGPGEARGALKVVQALQCPQTMGSLTRKGSASAEGTICTYAGPRGAEVTLHLVELDETSPAQVLTAFEARLSAAMPQAVAQLKAAGAPGSGQDGGRAPGVDVRADGDEARVRIGGFQIDASRRGAAARDPAPEGDNVSVQAHQDAVEIRTRGGGGATRASWTLTDSRPSEGGWRLVGYEARGPAGGPIVVATMRARDRDQVFGDGRDLVALNVGE